MSNPIKIEAEVDLEAIQKAIEKSGKLEDDEAVFASLAQVAAAKRQVQDALEEVEKVEREVKVAINGRAKALYGDDWRVIKGSKFKINRQFTGNVYVISDLDKVQADFVKLDPKPNSKTIDDFVETNNTLPDGIERNPNRNESIRIAVAEDEDSKA